MSSWIEHVKKTRAKHSCSYKEALQLASKTYRKRGGATSGSTPMADETTASYETSDSAYTYPVPTDYNYGSTSSAMGSEDYGTPYEYVPETAPKRKPRKKKVSGLKALGRKLRGLF